MGFKYNIKIGLIIIYLIELCYSILIVKNNENNFIVGKFIDIESLFGSDFDDGIQSYIVESEPILACNHTIEPPPTRFKNISNIIFVSLIRRGNCTFEHKVRVAQNSGYYGVVIYNNNSDRIFPMPKPNFSPDEPVHIPSRMVGLTSGNRLRNYTFTSSRHQYIVIFKKDFDFNPQCYIIAFLGFVSLGFLIIGIVFAVKLCRDFCKRRANRLKKCHLKKIPVKKFVKGDDPYDTCAICLEDFNDGDKLRILLCNHAYHMKCIDPWLLKQKRNCPVCKSRVRIPGRVEDSDDNISASTSSENTTATVDEHTPLINSRDGITPHFYFGGNTTEIICTAVQPKTNNQKFYENPCITTTGDNAQNCDPIVVISQEMAPYNTDDQSVLVTSNVNDHVPGTASSHPDDTLTKIV